MTGTVAIGGLPVIELAASGGEGLGLTRALLAPGQAMMLLQLWARLPDLGEVELIASRPLEAAAAKLNRRDGPYHGNTAFGFGGAILAPFANRVTGRLKDGRLDVDTGEGEARLAPNGDAGARPFAIHGLILDAVSRDVDTDSDHAAGTVRLGDDHAWPSAFELRIGWRLSPQRLALTVEAKNVGPKTAPIGLGWHPYFRLPSGDRRQARLHVPAETRTLVNNYAAVLPTGALEGVAGTPYDFTAPEGRALGDLFLDDCFLDLTRDASGEAAATISDPASSLLLKIASTSPEVSAFQVYAPPDKAFVVVEPQFNLADPFNPIWGGQPTGMVSVTPQGAVTYEARIELG